NPIGNEQLSAEFDANGLTLNAPANDSSTALTVPSAPVPSGQLVTLTATVSSSTPGAPTPAGIVTFFNGSDKLDSAPLVNGVATLTTDKLTFGAYSISAFFEGSATFV